ncbi:MAG TPA: hypothetical protein VE863_06290, partial [Pyrinomonadaceae bacterium]|nr:hypothetical protein [Pyrinomonadaceae bacterium]
TELGVLENRLRADEQAKRELESQFEKQLSDLIMERERELIIFRGDFAFGIVARNLLRGEDILPHFDTVVAA